MITKYNSSTDNQYFTDGKFNFEQLAEITSIKFVADLRSKLLLDKIERISINNQFDDSKFIYIYANHHDITNNTETCIILECYFIADGYYNIRYVSSNALSALDLTVTQL